MKDDDSLSDDEKSSYLSEEKAGALKLIWEWTLLNVASLFTILELSICMCLCGIGLDR